MKVAAIMPPTAKCSNGQMPIYDDSSERSGTELRYVDIVFERFANIVAVTRPY
jgi:hypothetical protein